MSRGNYIFGHHPVAEALRARPRDIQRLYLAAAGHSTRLSDLARQAEKSGIPVVVLPRRALESLVGAVTHQGVVAAVTPFAYADSSHILAAAQRLGEPPLLLALDGIEDPHNLGSLVRSAFALGAHGIVIPKDRACEVTATVVKASAGATAHLPIARVTNLRRELEELKQAGLWIVGAAASADKSLVQADLAGPCAIVIGSEGRGLRRLVGETCDELCKIPMAGQLGSLNASVAGALFLYEAARQRRAQGPRGREASPSRPGNV